MRIIIIILILFSYACSANIVIDEKSGLIWQDNIDSKTNYETWIDAKNYCSILILDGIKDWRLPSKKELKSIVDKNRTPTIKSNFHNTANYYYWSLDSLSDTTAIVISFDTGQALSYSKSGYVAFRCVNSKQLAKEKKDAIAKERKRVAVVNKKKKIAAKKAAKKAKEKLLRKKGIYHEINSPLMWQDDNYMRSEDWEDATDYCTDLNLGGYDDWRLPSIKELQSIVDIKSNGRAIKKGFIYSEISFHWSSTKLSYNRSEIWGVSFYHGKTETNNEYNVRNFRCVRGKEAWEY